VLLDNGTEDIESGVFFEVDGRIVTKLKSSVRIKKIITGVAIFIKVEQDNIICFVLESDLNTVRRDH
jgi:hypothetical protein